MTSHQLRQEAIARDFHETYERLAPEFGYETRQDTKQFDPDSKNGKLMVAVCDQVVRRALANRTAPAADTQDLDKEMQDRGFREMTPEESTRAEPHFACAAADTSAAGEWTAERLEWSLGGTETGAGSWRIYEGDKLIARGLDKKEAMALKTRHNASLAALREQGKEAVEGVIDTFSKLLKSRDEQLAQAQAKQ